MTVTKTVRIPLSAVVLGPVCTTMPILPWPTQSGVNSVFFSPANVAQKLREWKQSDEWFDPSWEFHKGDKFTWCEDGSLVSCGEAMGIVHNLDVNDNGWLCIWWNDTGVEWVKTHMINGDRLCAKDHKVLRLVQR